MSSETLVATLARRLRSRRVRAAMRAMPEIRETLRKTIDAAVGFSEVGETQRAYTWCAAATLGLDELEEPWALREAEAQARAQAFLRRLGGDEEATRGLAAVLAIAATCDPTATQALLTELEAASVEPDAGLSV